MRDCDNIPLTVEIRVVVRDAVWHVSEMESRFGCGGEWGWLRLIRDTGKYRSRIGEGEC